MSRALPVCRLAAVLAALPWLLAPGALPAAPDPVCQAAGEVASVLDRVQDLAQECGRPCFDRRVAAVEEALERHPRDVHLHRELMDLLRNPPELSEARLGAREAVLARYRELAREHPDDALWQYLAGRSVRGRDASRPFYEAAVTADPAFPWGHLGVAFVSAYSGEPERAAEPVRELLARCPERLDLVASFQRRIEDDTLWRELALETRKALSTADLARVYERYRTVWETLYVATPLAEHEGISAMVREDLARLEAPAVAARLAGEEEWWRVREAGHEHLGDRETRDRLEAERLARFPCTVWSARDRSRAWDEAHPAPPGTAPEAERHAHARASIEQAERWLEECPEAEVHLSRWIRAAKGLEDLPPARVGEIGERYLSVAEIGAGSGAPSPATEVAELYLEHGVRLDRVTDLVRRGLEASLALEREFLAEPDLPEHFRESVARSVEFHRWQALHLAVGAAIARRRPEEAEEALAGLAALMDDTRPGEEATAEEELIYRTVEGTYWTRRAELAASEGAVLDAAVFHARAAALSPDGAAGETGREAREAWEAAGGSAEAWQALLEAGAWPGAGAAQSSPWKELETGLPEFEVSDLVGRSWRLASFRGKAVFANVWATWCGPCRKELPLVEKLHERLEGRDDLLLVTLNVDSNPAVAKRYMEEHEYTFPVLLAQDLVDEVATDTAIPRTWILDPGAVIRREKLGFGGEGDEWLDEVVELLEAAYARPKSSS